MPRAYLDHASSAPLRPAARAAIQDALDLGTADPGRLHQEGREVRRALEDARARIAAFLGARPREVILTSSGTEAINAAVFGALARGRERSGGAHVVTTAVEHSAVLDACRRHASDLTVVGVDGLGRFDPAEVVASVRHDSALVTVQLANHEVGTWQLAAEVAEALADREVLVHVDACAAVGHAPVDFSALGAHLLSVTAHKLGGPAGAGALLVRRGVRVPPLLVGGAQERARRGGMEDLVAAAGFAAACAELGDDGSMEREAAASRERTDRIRGEVEARVSGVVFHGDPRAGLPHLVSLGIDGVEAEPILLGLDQAGIAVHSGSSCSSETLEPSPVLAAMGVDAEHSLRVSVGWTTTDEDVDRFLDVLPDVVARLRALR